MTESKRINVLIVDDEVGFRQMLAQYLNENYQYDVKAVADRDEAIQVLQEAEGRYDVALIDQYLSSGPDGIEVMKEIKRDYPYMECIILTGWGDSHKQTAQEAGAFHYIEKPFENEVLAQLVRLAAQQSRMSIISRDIGNGMELSLAIRQIMENAISLALADDAEFYLVDSTAGLLQRYVLSDPSIQEKIELNEAVQPFYEVIQQEKVVSIPVLGENQPESIAFNPNASGSFIGIPIPNRSGALCLYSASPNHFDLGGMIALLKTLAGQAALVLHNARAFSEIRVNARYMKALVEVTRELSANQSLQEQLEAAWRFVSRELAISTFMVGIYDAKTRRITYPLVYDEDQRIHLETVSLDDPQGALTLSAYVVRHGEELIWKNSSERGRICQELGIRSMRIGRACESCLYLPLKLGDEVIGITSIQKYEPFGFTDMVLGAFRSLANHMTVAIQNKQLMDVFESSSKELNALNQMVLDISQELDRKLLLEKIIQKAVDLLPAEGGAIYLLDEGEQVFHLTVAVGKTYHQVGQRLPVSQGLNHLIFSTGVPQAIEDYRHWDGRVRSLDRYNLTAVAGAPIRMGNRILGTLIVDSTHPERNFSANDLNLLLQFATHAGLALSKVTLIEKVEAIQKISAAIVSNPDDHQLLNQICQAAVELFHVDHSGYLERSKTRDFGVVKGEYPPLRTIGERIPILGVPVEEQLFNRLMPAVIPDIELEKESLGEVYETLASHDIRSILLVPIVFQDQVLGSFSLDVIGHTMQFSEQDVEFCKVFASHMAVAVKNIALMKEAVRHQNTITSLFEASRAVMYSSEPDVILQKIAAETQKATGAWRVAIILMGNELPSMGAQVGYDEQADYAAHIRSGGVSQQVFQTNTPLFFEATSENSSPLNPALVSQGVKSAACLPMSTDKQVLGVLWVHYDQYREFSDFEKHALGIYANVAATSIEKARQFLSTRLSAEGLAKLQTSAVRLSTSLEVSEFIRSACKGAVQSLNAHHASIILFDPASAWGTVRAEFPELGLAGKTFLLKDTCLEAHNLGLGEYFLLSVSYAEKVPDLLQIALEEARIRAALLLPIMNRNRQLVGVLEIGTMDPNRQFTAEDGEKCQIFATQVGIGVENAILFETVQQSQQRYDALDQATLRLRRLRTPEQLYHAIMHEGMDLANCSCGCIYLNRPYLGDLMLLSSEGLEKSAPESVSHQDFLVGAAARTAEVQTGDENGPGFHTWREILQVDSFIAIPLGNFGEVDGVLVLGKEGSQGFPVQELEILARYALQATSDLRTLRTIGRERRIALQLDILQEISRYILQDPGNTEKTLHVVLTGVTADYGLRFNRAGLFLLDEKMEFLVGLNGIGQVDEAEARKAWREDRVHGFGEYKKLLDQAMFELTPIGKRVQKARIPARTAMFQKFFKLLCEQRCLIATSPQDYVGLEAVREIFEPTTPLVFAPLIVGEQAIGLLVADNKFTQSPISPEIQEALLTYVSTAAVAIYNSRLFRSIMESRQRIRSFFEASNQVVPSIHLSKVLDDIVRIVPQAVGANHLDVLLMDEHEQVSWFLPNSYGAKCCLEYMDWLVAKSYEVYRSNQPQEFLFPGNLPDCPDSGAPACGICCPLAMAGKVIGVVWLYFCKPREFSVDEMESLQLYIKHAALTYDSSRRMRRMELLRRSVEHLANQNHMPEAGQLKWIAKYAREVFEASAVLVCPCNPETGELKPDELQGSFINPPMLALLKQMDWGRSRSAGKILREGYGSAVMPASGEYLVDDELIRLLRKQGFQAFQGVNLRLGMEDYGVLLVIYNQPRFFDAEDRAMLEAFGYNVAMALRRERLYTEVETYAASLSLVRDKASRLAHLMTQSDQHDALNNLPVIIRDLLQCDMVNLYTFNEETGRIEELVRDGSASPQHLARPDQITPRSTVWNILSLEKPYYHYSEEAEVDRLLNGRFVAQEKIISAMGIQLRVMDERLGVMFINYRKLHHFTQEDVQNILLFANQAAVVIKNIRNYQAISQRQKSLEVLVEAGKKVSSSLSVEESLKQIALQAWRLIQHRNEKVHCCYILHAVENELLLSAAYPPIIMDGLENKAMSHLQKDMDSGVIWRACQCKKTQLVNDVEKEDGYIPVLEETQAKVSVPILYEDELLGIIVVEHPDLGAFNRLDVQALEALSAQAALAIRNAKQYKDLEQIKGFVGSQTALEWMKMLSENWGHSIRNKVSNVLQYANLIRHNPQEVENIDKLEEILKQIGESPLTEPLSAEGRVDLIEFNRTIQEDVNLTKMHEPYNRVEWKFGFESEIDLRYRVRASKAWLRQGIRILLENAIQAMQKNDPGKPMVCTIRTSREKNQVLLYMINTGPEIPARIKDNLFKQPVVKLPEETGSGIGLMIAKTIFEAYQGGIELLYSNPEETAFRIHLPLFTFSKEEENLNLAVDS